MYTVFVVEFALRYLNEFRCLEGELEHLKVSLGQQRRQSSISIGSPPSEDIDQFSHSETVSPTLHSKTLDTERLVSKQRSSSAYNFQDILDSPSKMSARLGSKRRASARSGGFGGVIDLPTCSLCGRIPKDPFSKLSVPCILVEGQLISELDSSVEINQGLDLDVHQQIQRFRKRLLTCKLCARLMCYDCAVQVQSNQVLVLVLFVLLYFLQISIQSIIH